MKECQGCGKGGFSKTNDYVHHVLNCDLYIKWQTKQSIMGAVTHANVQHASFDDLEKAFKAAEKALQEQLDATVPKKKTPISAEELSAAIDYAYKPPQVKAHYLPKTGKFTKKAHKLPSGLQNLEPKHGEGDKLILEPTTKDYTVVQMHKMSLDWHRRAMRMRLRGEGGAKLGPEINPWNSFTVNDPWDAPGVEDEWTDIYPGCQALAADADVEIRCCKKCHNGRDNHPYGRHRLAIEYWKDEQYQVCCAAHLFQRRVQGTKPPSAAGMPGPAAAYDHWKLVQTMAIDEGYSQAFDVTCYVLSKLDKGYTPVLGDYANEFKSHYQALVESTHNWSPSFKDAYSTGSMMLVKLKAPGEDLSKLMKAMEKATGCWKAVCKQAEKEFFGGTYGYAFKMFQGLQKGEVLEMGSKASLAAEASKWSANLSELWGQAGYAHASAQKAQQIASEGMAEPKAVQPQQWSHTVLETPTECSGCSMMVKEIHHAKPTGKWIAYCNECWAVKQKKPKNWQHCGICGVGGVHKYCKTCQQYTAKKVCKLCGGQMKPKVGYDVYFCPQHTSIKVNGLQLHNITEYMKGKADYEASWDINTDTINVNEMMPKNEAVVWSWSEHKGVGICKGCGKNINPALLQCDDCWKKEQGPF